MGFRKIVRGKSLPKSVESSESIALSFVSLSQTTQEKVSAHTLTSADSGKLIQNSGALTVTVQGLEIGQQVDFLQAAAGQITFQAGSGVTLNSKDSKLKTAEQWSPASIKCIGTNTYVLAGDLGD